MNADLAAELGRRRDSRDLTLGHRLGQTRNFARRALGRDVALSGAAVQLRHNASQLACGVARRDRSDELLDDRAVGGAAVAVANAAFLILTGAFERGDVIGHGLPRRDIAVLSLQRLRVTETEA